MTKKVDIHKAAAIIIKDRRLLVSRSKNKSFFIAPGGKIEKNETPEQAVIRELHEEQGITITENDLTFFGSFYAIAQGFETEQLTLRMDVYSVASYDGKISPQSEIEENKWINTTNMSSIELGSIFAHDVVPKLHQQNLID